MKNFLALAGLLFLASSCGSSGGGSTPPPSGPVLTVTNFDQWCTITVNGSPSAGTYSTFAAGTVVNLDATANAGFTFAYWLGTAGAGANGMDTNAATTVTTTSSDQTVLACCNNPPGQVCPTSL